MVAAEGLDIPEEQTDWTADQSLDIGIASLENALSSLMDAKLPLATAYVDFVLQLCLKERDRREPDNARAGEP